MLAPTANSQRFLQLTQLLLTFVSVCAVVDSSRFDRSATDRPGYYSGAAGPRDATHDRRFGDLARTERKRREAEQLANRRRAAQSAVSIARAAEKWTVPALSGSRPISSATDSIICASCRVSETVVGVMAGRELSNQALAVGHVWHASCSRGLEPRYWSTA